LVPGSVRKVWFAAGGTIAAVLEDGRVIGWDARLDVVPFVPVGAAGGEFEGVGFAAGGGLVLTVSPSGVTQAWNAATGLPEVPFARHAIETTGRVRVDPIAEPDALASPDSQHEASPDPDDARIVRIRAGRNTRLLRHESDVRRICFSADGRLLATACRDASVHVWSARDGRRVGKALPHSDAVWALVFSRDGRRLAVVSSRGEVHLWDPAQSARLRDPVPVNGLAQMIALDPRDRSLLVAADPRVPARIVPLVPRLPAALSPAAAVRLADAGQEIAGVTVSRDGNPERRQALATRDEVRARIAAALRDAETIRPGEVQDFFQWFSKEPEKRPAWPWQEPPR
jgi:WD40 repeat protein